MRCLVEMNGPVRHTGNTSSTNVLDMIFVGMFLEDKIFIASSSCHFRFNNLFKYIVVTHTPTCPTFHLHFKGTG